MHKAFPHPPAPSPSRDRRRKPHIRFAQSGNPLAAQSGTGKAELNSDLDGPMMNHVRLEEQTMTTQVTATVVGGLLKPDEALSLADQSRVRLTIEPIEEWSAKSAVAAWES